MSPLMEAIEYRPAGDTHPDIPYRSLVGDVEVVLRDRERGGKLRPILISSQPRGARVTSLIAQDAEAGLARGQNQMGLDGMTAIAWDVGNPFPPTLADRPAYIDAERLIRSAPGLHSFFLDTTGSLSINNPSQWVIMGTASKIFRAEQAVTRQRRLWGSVLKPFLQGAISAVGTVAGAYMGAAGTSAVASAFVGLASRSLTMAMDVSTRRADIQKMIGGVLGTLTGTEARNVATAIMDANQDFVLSAAVRIPQLSLVYTKAMAMRSAAIEAGVIAPVAATIANVETRAQALKTTITARNAPYRIDSIVVYT